MMPYHYVRAMSIRAKQIVQKSQLAVYRQRFKTCTLSGNVLDFLSLHKAASYETIGLQT